MGVADNNPIRAPHFLETGLIFAQYCSSVARAENELLNATA